MKSAELVTFGGSNLNRAGELRNDPDALAAARNDPAARYVTLWRGKPLVDASQDNALALLSGDHPVLREDSVLPEPTLLGLDENSAPYFAKDIAGWEPAGQDLSSVNQFLDPSEQSHPALPEHIRFAELRRVMTHLSPRDAELAATAKAIIGWHANHGFCSKCGEKTHASEAGWQRTCPACNATHFPRTDPVVIMLITHGNELLIGRSPGWPEGMYSLLAGFVDAGETLEAAVRREVFEEAGVRVGEVEYLASQPWPFPCSLMMGCRGTALSHDIQIDPAEIEDAMWISREEMMQVFAGENEKIKPARKGAIAHYLIQNWLSDTLD